ncbi:Serine proteases trypsin domain [Trinorchestia longiramus]|nr:Serine proteases trypsin domain [Trinorchestia longiramus]
MLPLVFLTTFFWLGETTTTKEISSHGRGAAGNACGDANAVGDCRAPLQCLAGGGQVTLSYTCPSTMLVCCTFTSGCGSSTRGRVSEWRNPSYPNTDVNLPDLCSYSITPASDTCYIRVEFTDLTAPSALLDACQDNVLTIYNQKEGSGSSLCGAFTGYTTFIRVLPSWLWFTNPVQLSLRIRTSPFKFSAKFTQLRCADVKSLSVTSRNRRDAQFNFGPFLGNRRRKPGPNFTPSKSELLAYKLAAQEALLNSLTTMATVSYPASTVDLENNLKNLAQDIALALDQQTGITNSAYQTETSTDRINEFDMSTTMFHPPQLGFTNVGSEGYFPAGTGANSFSTSDASLMTLDDMNLVNALSLQPTNSQTEINSFIPNGYTNSFLPTELQSNTNSLDEFSTPVTEGLDSINTLDINSILHLNQNQLLHSDDNIQSTVNHLSTSSPFLSSAVGTIGSSYPLDLSTFSTVSPTGSYNWPSTFAPLVTGSYPSSSSRPGDHSHPGNFDLHGNYNRLGSLNPFVNLNRPGILFRPNGRFNFSSNLEKLTASYLSENLASSEPNFAGNTISGEEDFNRISSVNGQNNDPSKPNDDYVSIHGMTNKFPHSDELDIPGMKNNYLTNLGDFSQHSLQLLNILASTTTSPKIASSLSGSPVEHSHVTGSFTKSGYSPFTTPSSTTLSPYNIMRPTSITFPLVVKGGQKITSQVAGNTGLAHLKAGSNISSAVGTGITYPPGINGITLPMPGNAEVTLSTLIDAGVTGTSSFSNNEGVLGHNEPSITGLTSSHPLDEALTTIVNNLNMMTTTAFPTELFTTTTSNSRPSSPYTPGSPFRRPTTAVPRPPFRRPTVTRPPLRSPVGADRPVLETQVSRRQSISTIFQSFLNKQSVASRSPWLPHLITRLAGGQQPSQEKFLFMGLSVLKTTQENYHACGATLITTKYALTAARCLLRKGLSDRNDVRVIFGTDRSIFSDDLTFEQIYSHSVSRKVAKVIFHPMVDHTTLRYDLAVLRVAQSYRDILPASLPPREAEFSGMGGTLLGWGLSESSQLSPTHVSPNPNLRSLDAVVLSNADCSKAWTGIRNPYDYTVSENIITLFRQEMLSSLDYTVSENTITLFRQEMLSSLDYTVSENTITLFRQEMLSSLDYTVSENIITLFRQEMLSSLDYTVSENTITLFKQEMLSSLDYTGTSPVIHDEMVCTRAATPSSGVCTGDEGGALIKRGVNGQNILVGILSSAHDCVESADGSGLVSTESNLPDIATRVSAFLDWIDAVTTEYRYPCGVDFYSFTYRECIL